MGQSDGVVHALKIEYFDTVAVGSSICGFLFMASEFGNQCLYQFQTLGEDGDETEFASAAYPSICTSNVLDTNTGQLGDTSSRFVGQWPVLLSHIKLQGTDALSSRAWIKHEYNNRTRFTPLLCDELNMGAVSRMISVRTNLSAYLGASSADRGINGLPEMPERCDKPIGRGSKLAEVFFSPSFVRKSGAAQHRLC
ncbi:hypothetical protein C8F04DRAFT_1179590 [Mycena alexandri]|uniref:RSE1/DDB1/CPSF1 first beta-propeller domain-containing protein n=1 Tax=Mycena alexandri TaxID=1745969 RepID=A0AAD6T346_9AGAR|nr:hypothetical protein C8F04DRAFT_1179590 [Mycena alexandri]